MAIFETINATLEKLKIKNKVYIQIMDLLGIPQNDTKNSQGINVMVFGIKIDTVLFIKEIVGKN